MISSDSLHLPGWFCDINRAFDARCHGTTHKEFWKYGVTNFAEKLKLAHF